MNANQQREKLNEPYQQAMDAAYRNCIEKERVRQAQRRLYTKQGRFDAAMERLDAIVATDKFRGASSLGTVVATAKEVKSLAARCKRKLDHACQDLRRHGNDHLVPVLRLIAKNGKNREESICELMKVDAKQLEECTSATANRSAKSGASKTRRKRRSSGQPKKS